MPTKMIDRHYDHFTPTERLTLFIEAMARNDDSEVDRLRTSCPRKTYLMTDTAFCDRIEFARDLASIVSSDLRWHLGKLWIAEVARDLGPRLTERHAFGARASFYEGYLLGRGEPPMDLLKHANEKGEVDAQARAEVDASAGADSDVSDDEPMSAEDAARFDVAEQYIQYADGFYARVWTPTIDRLAQDFKSIWTAFEGFTTKELNVEPLTLLGAFCPPVAQQVRAALLRYAKVEADKKAVAEYVEGIEEAWKSVVRH